jgi:glycosyltransferase involved in cell wall biosynthesis
MTGGLQEQVTDGKNWFGVGIQPISQAIVGSQEVPYIYEDRVSGEDVISALNQIHNMSREQRQALGKMGREHVDTSYSYTKFKKKWVNLMTSIHEKHGSWENRREYQGWELLEL